MNERMIWKGDCVRARTPVIRACAQDILCNDIFSKKNTTMRKTYFRHKFFLEFSRYNSRFFLRLIRIEGGKKCKNVKM